MSRQQLHIGSITSGYRNIRSGSQYEKYFNAPEQDDRIIIQDGEVTDTVELMKKVVWKYLSDTEKIAKELKSPSVKRTSENIWNFLYHHIQYKLDQEGLEQLRRPARSWADRKSGIDCDCFAIFCSSILTNLEIPHSFRITKYDGSEYFQHVYVVVPYGGGLIKIDPVLSTFNYEKPFSTKRDIPMNLNGIDVAVLSGTPGVSESWNGSQIGDLQPVTNNPQDDAVYNYLLETRATVSQIPEGYSGEFLAALEYAIKHWHTPRRQEALDFLAALEANQGLGRLNREGKFFKNLQKVGRGAKKTLKTVVKYNPVSTLARTGLLLALKLNLKGMRKKLMWGYATAAQAQRAGIDPQTHKRTQEALFRVGKMWTKKLFGKEETLRSIILKGNDEGLSGQLGAEPVTTAAAITAATPVIVAVIKILKDAGLISKNEDASEGSIKAELSARAANPGYDSSYPSAVAPMGPSPGEAGNFLKNNSTLLVAGAGVVLVGGYFLLRKKPAKAALSGGQCLNGTCKKKAPAKRKAPSKPRIKKVTLS
ncbi:MAG: hypothetical protein DWQ21_07310 [Bacteroidetes bacterium]|nr:MAG: hypothetical protein DWQ21_07310 [Bacteroidota bacterium]REK64295.1 MAG: hypothetical protein DWQ49_01755 [Bacteroidota bacterium]